MPKEVYISSSEPFTALTTHGEESETWIFHAEQDSDGYAWPQDFYRDTTTSLRFNGDVLVEISMEDEL